MYALGLVFLAVNAAFGCQSALDLVKEAEGFRACTYGKFVMVNMNARNRKIHICAYS